MSKVLKKLFDMQYDEISVVDRGANQHAAIVFSKADGSEEDSMPDIDLYDAYGNPVDDLDIGDIVYDEQGNEYQYVEVDDSDDVYEPELEYAEYGKSADYEGVAKFRGWPKGALTNDPVGRFKSGFGMGSVKRAAKKDLRRANGGKSLDDMNTRTEANLVNDIDTKFAYGRVGRAGEHLSMNRGRYGAGALAATSVPAGAYAYERTRKSLGDVVLEELAKADSESERSAIIAKAMQEVEVAKAQANEAWEMVAKQEDAMLEQAFISKAAEYNLPVDPVELGIILKAASTVLDAEQLDLLDGLFEGIGEMLYQEHGYVGDTDNNSVMDVVNGFVGENIGKSDWTPEEMATAVFESNPAAYDQYLAEQKNWW